MNTYQQVYESGIFENYTIKSFGKTYLLFAELYISEILVESEEARHNSNTRGVKRFSIQQR